MFKHVLLAIQDLLANPNPCDPTQPEAAILLVQVRSCLDLFKFCLKVVQGVCGGNK